MSFEDYWNQDHLSRKDQPVHYDDWLRQYDNIISNCNTVVIDLGCGVGNNTLYLTEKGLKVIACDYAIEAINIVNKNIPQAQTKLFNMEDGLPFADEITELVVADLSLHYFSDDKTRQIMQEIKRVLKPGGHLLARVNSFEDDMFGANQGELLEHHYYYTKGYNKRFFDEADIEQYFSIVGKAEYHKGTMTRYAYLKKLYEVAVEK